MRRAFQAVLVEMAGIIRLTHETHPFGAVQKAHVH